jgi:hypothetical protein
MRENRETLIVQRGICSKETVMYGYTTQNESLFQRRERTENQIQFLYPQEAANWAS